MSSIMRSILLMVNICRRKVFTNHLKEMTVIRRENLIMAKAVIVVRALGKTVSLQGVQVLIHNWLWMKLWLGPCRIWRMDLMILTYLNPPVLPPVHLDNPSFHLNLVWLLLQPVLFIGYLWHMQLLCLMKIFKSSAFLTMDDAWLITMRAVGIYMPGMHYCT